MDSTKTTDKSLDRSLVGIICIIFATLLLMAYLMLSILSILSIISAAALTLYTVISGRRTYGTFRYGRHAPSIFSISLLVLPLLLGAVIAYDGFSVWQSSVVVIVLFGLNVTFWNSMLTVPLAVYSKRKELTRPAHFSYERLSIIVPAHNEEKEISRTIEALIEADYPKKEIIVVDDGSTDRTLQISNYYREHVKVLHKENGGKSSAINYALKYAKGEIIVVVDADTIVGRESLKEVARAFTDKHVAAVAGNIKVLNKRNWLTWCQALEYLFSIQVTRRAFDVFGSVTVVPGCLGAFRREVFEQAGTYDRDTLVEDYNQTLKTLKSRLIVQGSSLALAYTEAPETLRDLYKQRLRWYRGNAQTLKKHSDALTNPRYGILHRLAFPFMILSNFVMPVIGLVVWASVVIAVIQGQGLLVLQLFLLFVMLQYWVCAMAVRMDEEDPRLINYCIFFVIGYKQLVDFILLKANLDVALKRKVTWTEVKRIGEAQKITGLRAK